MVIFGIVNIFITLLCLYIFLTMKKNSLFYVNKPERWDLFIPIVITGIISLILITVWTIKIIIRFHFILLLLLLLSSLITYFVFQALNIDLREFQNKLSSYIVLLYIVLVGNIYCTGNIFLNIRNCQSTL